jgi:hypothetical protein
MYLSTAETIHTQIYVEILHTEKLMDLERGGRLSLNAGFFNINFSAPDVGDVPNLFGGLFSLLKR